MAKVVTIFLQERLQQDQMEAMAVVEAAEVVKAMLVKEVKVVDCLGVKSKMLSPMPKPP